MVSTVRKDSFIAADDWLDAIPVPACVVDGALQVLMANPRLRALLPGRSANLADLFRECDRNLPASIVGQAFEGGSARAEFIPVASERRYVIQGGGLSTSPSGGCLLTIFPLDLPATDAEARYQSLAVNVAADGLVLFDESGSVLYANQSAAALRGSQPPRMQRMSWSVVYPHEKAFRLISEVVDSKGRWEGETQIERYDGAQATLTVTLVRLEAGVYCAHERDVTLQKLAEYVFLESERLHEALFSQSLDGFFIMLADAPINTALLGDDAYLGSLLEEVRLAKANDAALTQFGLSRTDFADRSFLQLLNSDAQRARRLLRILLKEGRYHAELSLAVHGKTSIIEGDYICLRDDDERITGFFGIQRDITERKRDEALLLQRTKTLESVYEVATTEMESGDAIITQVLTKIGDLLRVPLIRFTSAALEQTWSLEGATVRGEAFKATDSAVAEVLAQNIVVRKAGRWTELFDGPAPLGLSGGLRFLGVPVRSREQRVLGALCAVGRSVFDDQEDDLRVLELFAAYLGHLVERHMLGEQIQRARRMELLGKITAGVAHEVRNPLNAIASITEALRLEIGNDHKYDDYLEHMRAQVRRLSTLMTELLELGRPLNASLVHDEPVDELVGAAVGLWRQSNPERVVSVYGRLAGVSLRTDGARMQQALINVLDNAHQHSAAGRPLAVHLDRAGGRVRVRIEDEGVGFTEDALRKVFEPFFTKRRDGTGLGMSIVKQIIEAHGGTVAVRNNESKAGATVEFSLPCSELPA